MKNKAINICIALLLATTGSLLAQTESEAPRPVRAPFESVWFIDGQTIMVPSKGTFEFDIQHRFGRMDFTEGRDKNVNLKSLWGLYSPSNIRLGFTYTPIDNLSVGFGNTKNDGLLDFNIKYAILKQTRDWSMPINLTYYGNAVVDTGEDNVDNGVQRWSYFHEIMIATKINSKLTIQVSGNYSHFNGVEESVYFKLNDAETDSVYRNDVIGLSVKARYKFTPTLSALVGYDTPLVGLYKDGQDYETDANISFGLEISTSSHAFQVFAGRYYDIIPQYNYAFNGSDDSARFLIGFNITRLWNF